MKMRFIAFIVPARKESRNNETRTSNIFHDSKRMIFICIWWGRLVVCAYIPIDTNYQSYLSVTYNTRISLRCKVLGHFTVGILISIKYAQNEHRNRFRFMCKTDSKRKKKQSVWPLNDWNDMIAPFLSNGISSFASFKPFSKCSMKKG